MAKVLLESKSIEFSEVKYGNDIERIQELAKKTGMRTMPQIFIDEKLIGGYDDLKSLDDKGLLDQMLSNEEE